MSIYIEKIQLVKTKPVKNRTVKKPRLAHTLALSIVCLSSLANVVNATTDTWFANGDGTVTDTATGLIWQQQDDNVLRTHANALTYCQGLTLASNSNWRLPNIKELTSIVDYRTDDPTIDEAAFLNVNSSSYWSASSRASSSSSAWLVSFFSGNVFSNGKANGGYVRCVR